MATSQTYPRGARIIVRRRQESTMTGSKLFQLFVLHVRGMKKDGNDSSKTSSIFEIPLRSLVWS